MSAKHTHGFYQIYFARIERDIDQNNFAYNNITSNNTKKPMDKILALNEEYHKLQAERDEMLAKHPYLRDKKHR